MAIEPVGQYDNVVKQLLARVPEFSAARVMIEFDNLPYVVFEEFAAFLRDGISAGSLSPHAQTEAFQLLNELAASDDGAVVNLVEVAVFDVLAENPQALEAAQPALAGKAKELLNEVLSRQSYQGRQSA